MIKDNARGRPRALSLFVKLPVKAFAGDADRNVYSQPYGKVGKREYCGEKYNKRRGFGYP
jgi:hypothetical protein